MISADFEAAIWTAFSIVAPTAKVKCFLNGNCCAVLFCLFSGWLTQSCYQTSVSLFL